MWTQKLQLEWCSHSQKCQKSLVTTRSRGSPAHLQGCLPHPLGPPYLLSPLAWSDDNDCHPFPDLLRGPPVFEPSHFLPGRTKVLLGSQSTLCPPLISCLLGSTAVDFLPGVSSTIAGRRSYSLHNPSTLQSNGNGIEWLGFQAWLRIFSMYWLR